MSPLPLIIVNPASAGGATGAAWPGVASEVRRHFGPFEVAFTKRGGEAVEIAEREARAGRRFLIACGGDGTVNEVANGILRAGASTELGVLPSGTGGDFRRTIRMPLRTADAALALREGLTRAMDAGKVTFRSDGRQLTDGGRELPSISGELTSGGGKLKGNSKELMSDGGELTGGGGELTSGGAEEETRFFVNVASFGMGGEVIRRVKERAGLAAGASRVLGGKLSFALAAIQSTLAFEKPAVRVALDDRAESQLTVTNFCVANARYFGGGMKIAPAALLDDGLFDVVAVGDLSALKVLANSYRVYLGTHLGMQQVRHARARLVTARPTGSEEVKLEIDGELAGRLPATFEILPKALRVRCPK